jgi:hypothetical protein
MVAGGLLDPALDPAFNPTFDPAFNPAQIPHIAFSSSRGQGDAWSRATDTGNGERAWDPPRTMQQRSLLDPWLVKPEFGGSIFQATAVRNMIEARFSGPIPTIYRPKNRPVLPY